MFKKLREKTYRFVNRYEQLRQVITYTVVGGFSALLDLILLFILVEAFGMWYLLAAFLSFITVSTIGFFLHKRFTFRHTGGRNKLRYAVFLFVAGSGLVLSMISLFTLVEVFGLWYMLAAVITKFMVLIWNFLTNKFITFGSLRPSFLTKFIS